VAGTLDIGTGSFWGFLTAGGAALAGTYTDAASQTTTNYVPLVDAAGTVIALVNPASPSTKAETVTYDPSGTPSVSGSADGWPFLYHGMEQESIDPSRSFARVARSGRPLRRASRSVLLFGRRGVLWRADHAFDVDDRRAGQEGTNW
jgi:hypothetical protein